MEARRELRTLRHHGLTAPADYLYDLTLLATGDERSAEAVFKERRRQEWEEESRRDS